MVKATAETIKLLGGTLCLDFANSVDWTSEGVAIARTDALVDTSALERWGSRLEVSTTPAGERELLLARDLREALHLVFSALATAQEPGAFALSRLRFAYAQAVASGQLQPREGGEWGLTWADDEHRRVRFAVAADAVALLADPARLARVRRCPGRDCGWLFLDTSGKRRWCSMATCGSREKMRRMYERKRAARSAT